MAFAKNSEILREMAEKEEGIVNKGHDESMKLDMDIYSEFGLPLGMLPLKDVIVVRSTGYVWIVQKEKGEHTFKVINKVVSYNTDVSGYIEKRRMKKIKGVKSKEIMLWAAVDEIVVDDPPSGKIHFKGRVGLTRTFPVEAFVVG